MNPASEYNVSNGNDLSKKTILEMIRFSLSGLRWKL
jgi:hypothetical protein